MFIKGVTFFNLPYEWRDSQVIQPWMALADRDLFTKQFPDIDIKNLQIIEWNIASFSLSNTIEKFYIVCKNLYVIKCKDEERNYLLTYKEPISQDEFQAKRFENRIPILKYSIH